ncbi:FHA domain-containing protein [Tropicimonas sp.]|uniref:FHA domain-containing protein n=1 Tax=Tropicimonas sp. TaxID=2067044 RepID=UPI003A88FE90
MSVIGTAVIADITGSTALYEGVGTQLAFRKIQALLARLRHNAAEHGGEFIHSRGDDILAFFDDPEAAFAAARSMVSNMPEDLLAVHAGLSWGSMLRVPGDLHGRPVNKAARLASLAKPHEVLVATSCYEHLGPAAREFLRSVDTLQLKGVPKGSAVYSFVAEDPMERTQLSFVRRTKAPSGLSITLWHEGKSIELTEARDVTVGRSDDNDIVVSEPWVSRAHATISVANGLVEFRDHSTGGSFLTLSDGSETVVRRSSATLVGSGEISLGAPQGQAGPAVLSFTVAKDDPTHEDCDL